MSALCLRKITHIDVSSPNCMLHDREAKPNRKLLHLKLEKILKVRTAIEKVVGKH